MNANKIISIYKMCCQQSFLQLYEGDTEFNDAFQKFNANIQYSGIDNYHQEMYLSLHQSYCSDLNKLTNDEKFKELSIGSFQDKTGNNFEGMVVMDKHEGRISGICKYMSKTECTQDSRNK